MNDSALRRHVEEALRAVDDTQLFERLVRDLLESDGWIVEPRGSGFRGDQDGGWDFRALRSECEFAGQSYHPAATTADPVKKVKRKLAETRRKLRKEVNPPSRILLVTSARIDPRDLAPKRPRPGARPAEDVVVLGRDWIIDKLLLPNNGHLLDRMGLERSEAVFGPRAYLSRLRSGHVAPLWVGREAERGALVAQLERHDVVFVSGVGGIGKSRLTGETALHELSLPMGRPWFFLGNAANPRTWSRELPIGRECVVVLDDPQRQPELLRTLSDHLLASDRARVKVVLTTRPDKLGEIRAQLPSGTECGLVEVKPLGERDTATLVRGLGLRDSADVHELVRLCEGNPQIACLLAPLRTRGTRFRSWTEGLTAFVDDLLAGLPAEAGRLLAFIASFPEFLLFEGPDPARPPRPDSPFERNRPRLWAKLREICGEGDPAIERLLDHLQNTGFVQRRRSRHGVSLVVVPDILAEAVVAREYFTHDAGSSRYRRDVFAFAADVGLRGHADRLASVALRSDSPLAKGMVRQACDEMLRDMRGDRGMDVLHGLIELRKFVPVAPQIALVVAKQVLDHPGVARGAEHGVATHDAVVGSAVVLVRGSLDVLPIDEQGTAMGLLADLAEHQADASGIESGRAALMDCCAGPGPFERREERLRWLTSWWRSMPDSRAREFGWILRKVMRSVRSCDENQAHRRLVDLAMAGLQELGARRSPERDAASLGVLELLVDEAVRHEQPQTRSWLLNGADAILTSWLLAMPNIALRAGAFDVLAAWSASGIPLTPGAGALWAALREDDHVRLHRHLQGTCQRWTDEGLPASEHWVHPESDPVLQDWAGRAESELPVLLDLVSRLRLESTRDGAPLRFDWLGAHLARRSGTLATTTIEEILSRADDNLASLAAGLLAELWRSDPDAATPHARRLSEVRSPLALDVLAWSLVGPIPAPAWDICRRLAEADAEFRSRLLDSAWRWAGPLDEADRILLELAALGDERHLRDVLERVHVSGDRQRDAAGLGMVTTLIRTARLDRNAWRAWEWVRALAQREPAVFVDAVLEASALRIPLASGRDALPAQLIDVVAGASLPGEVRARLVSACLSAVDADEAPMACRSALLLQEMLSPAELRSTCADASRDWPAGRARLEALGPSLPTSDLLELLPDLAERLDESELSILESIVQEHVAPSGHLYSTPVPGVSEMETMGQALSRAIHPNVAELGRRLALTAELQRDEAAVDD